MRVAVKPSHRAYIETFSKVSEARAPVVQPVSAKLSLGSTANSYLTNLAEVNAATAVISSIGQTPLSFLRGEKANNSQIFPANVEALDTHSVHLPSQENNQQALLVNTPSQIIHSLSELSPNLQTLSVSSSQVKNADGTQTREASLVGFLTPQDQTTITEILSLANLSTSNTVNRSSVGEVPSTLSMNLAAANDTFNLSGLLTIINLMPISSVTSLSTSAGVASEFRELITAEVFEGITVSGQADSVDFLVINTSVMPSRGAVSANFANIADTEISSYVVAQHSIILIGIVVTQTTEGFGQ